jgi:hypothetical protein
MAIVFDAAQGSGPIFANTRTWAHTVGENEGRVLIAGMTAENPGIDVTLWTFAGIPMGFLGVAALAGNIRTWMYGMINPPIGLNNVVVNLSGNAALACGSVSYDGVDPINTYGPVATNTGNSNTPSVVVASAEGEVVVDTMGYHGRNSATTIGALQTQRVAAGSGVALPGYRGSDEPGAAAITMSWTINGGAANWRTVGISLKPLASARGRATKYFFPFWNAAPKLFDANGKIVDPSDILADEWVEAEGLGFATAENPESFIEDPSRSKIIEVNASQASARIKTNTNQFAEVLVSRVAAGS